MVSWLILITFCRQFAVWQVDVLKWQGSREKLFECRGYFFGFLWAEIREKKDYSCGEIGFLPNGLWHVRLTVSGANSCEAIKIVDFSLLILLVLKVKQQSWFNFVVGCAMESSMTFCLKNVLEAPWGPFKEMHTNTQGQSDIVTHNTNIWN